MAYRTTVLWMGSPLTRKGIQAFKSRGLVYVPVTSTMCAKLWNSARAAVFWHPTDEDFLMLAGGGLVDALAHGLLVRIVVPFEDLRRRREQLKDIPSFGLGGWWLLTNGSPTRIAEDFARHVPGPAHDQRINLHGDVEGLVAEEKVLLERAFHDCSEVHLQRLPDGTAKVFLAFAKLNRSQVGEYPLPLFIKIDKRDRAEKEREHYAQCTTAFVPFYARPNLHQDRCLMGAHRGLIVGDFVERSEGLLELAQRGDAQRAIDSLFQDALRGWRAQPYGNKEPVTEARLYAQCIPDQVLKRKHDMLSGYSATAMVLGSRMDLFEVAKRLDALPPIKHRRAFTHGDLHCGNVRARAGEAILIDFQSVGPGPLSTDPATLEVSLCLEFKGTEADWQATMSQLYSVENLRTVPRTREPTAPLNALWDVVRQLRRYGLAEQVEEDEYCRAVAIQLLRKAAHGRNLDEQGNRRPFLIMLAAALVRALERQASANDPKFLAAG